MTSIHEINKLLINARKLTGNNNTANEASVKTRYNRTFSYYQKESSYENALLVSEKLEFLINKNSSLIITETGNAFLELLKGDLEPTKEQKIFLGDMLVESDNLSAEFKNVFSNFRIDYSEQDPVWRFDKTSGKTSDNFTDVFEGLGIFKKDGGNIYVPPDKNPLVSFVKNKPKSGKIDFEQSNKIKSEVGRKGELATLEYEDKRLREELAVRIEPAFLFDDYRGYDISSYNDKDSKANEYDRKIEVKSTKDSEPHFFWSGGEIKKSMELGDQYFIYVWTDVLGPKRKLNKIIKNPYKEIICENEKKLKPIVSFYIESDIINNINDQK